MQKLPMHTKNIADENFKKLAELFPQAVTEVVAGYDENNKPIIERAIDKDVLMAEIAAKVVDGPNIGENQRYQFTWPDKAKTVHASNQPIYKTLRPCREESVNFDNTENLYIEGDNLEVLKLLQESYLGKVKMIYIDPPYNTGNDFVYNDRFTMDGDDWDEVSGDYDEEGNRLFKNTDSNGRFHTDWLNMLYPRLKVARDLLSDDGVIFISIDDNEVHNLRKICDEVFGAENFIGMFSVEVNPKGRKNSKFISVTNDYCIVFSKKKEFSYFIESIPKNVKDLKKDEHGTFVHNSGKRVLVGENKFNKKVDNLSSNKHYSIYYSDAQKNIEILKEESIHSENTDLIKKGYERYYSYNDTFFVENTYSDEKIRQLFYDNKLEFKNKKIYEKNTSTSIRIKSLLVNKQYDAVSENKIIKYFLDLKTTSAGTQLNELLGISDKIFENSKNTSFISTLIKLLNLEDNDIILDFFSGSATTAHAVMQLNAEDGGKRKFIMVQLPEPTDEKSEAFKADYTNICEIGKERIRRAGAKVRERVLYENQPLKAGEGFECGVHKIGGDDKSVPDLGFRVLKVDSTNMEHVYYTPKEYTQNMLVNLEENIKKDRTPEDLLFQVMLELAVPLSSRIEELTIDNTKVFSVDNGYLMASFDSKIQENTVEHIAKQKPYYFVMRDSSIGSDSLSTNFEQIFATYSPDTQLKVL